MTRDPRLLWGCGAAALFGIGIVGLGFGVPGYSQVQQTVSEIGEVGSPARLPFSALLCAVAVLLLLFAAAVRRVTLAERRSSWGVWLIAFMAVPATGIGVFAYPHPLHNVFGFSELIGYQAPLAFALGWRRGPEAGPIASLSWVFFGLIWIAILLNLTPLFRAAPLWAEIRPVYGLVQRSLFATWFGWCAILSLMLWRRSGRC